MIPPPDKKAVQEGVADGIYGWLVDHPITAHGVVEVAIRSGVRSWLDDNKDEIVEMMAPETGKPRGTADLLEQLWGLIDKAIRDVRVQDAAPDGLEEAWQILANLTGREGQTNAYRRSQEEHQAQVGWKGRP